MGTAFSFAVRSATDPTSPLDEGIAWLRAMDAAFSPYVETSWVCRLRRREVSEADCPAEVKDVLDRCRELGAATGGYFSLLPSGELDPCGLVKGWAVEQASTRLAALGAPCHAISGGGDVRIRASADDPPWRVGIADPHRPSEVVAVVTGRDLAIATSGITERGEHIVDPHTGRPATDIASATVVGPDLGTADAYATAAVAMGDRAARRWLADLAGHEAFLVTAGEELWATAGFGM